MDREDVVEQCSLFKEPRIIQPARSWYIFGNDPHCFKPFL